MAQLDTDISVPKGPADPKPTYANSAPPARTAERSDFYDGARVWSPPLEAVWARWTWVVAGAVLAGMLSFLVPVSEQSTASAVMQLSNGDVDSLRAKQLGQTVERTVTSEAVMAVAAATRGINAADLRNRVAAKWEVDTDLVIVTVTGSDPQATVKDANAVADAVLIAGEQQARDRLSQIQRDSNDLVKSGALKDAAAEAARRSQLGASVAGRQDSASSTSTAVALLDPAVEAQGAGLSRSLRLVLGLVAGILLAAAAAVLIPMERRRARSVREVAGLSTDVKVATFDGSVGDLAGRLIESDRQNLAIVALPETGEEAAAFAEEVAVVVRHHGASVAVVSPVHREDGERTLGRAGRARIRRELEADVLVAVVPDEDWALRLLRGQTGLHVVVVAGRGHTRLGDIWRSTTALDLAHPTVVISR